MADMLGPIQTNRNLRNSFRGNSQKPDTTIPLSTGGMPMPGSLPVEVSPVASQAMMSEPLARNPFQSRSQKPGVNLPVNSGGLMDRAIQDWLLQRPQKSVR